MVTPDAGQVLVDGKEEAVSSPRDARRLGFAFLHQDLNDVPGLDVSANLWMGHRLPRNRWRRIDWAGARARTAELLDLVGCSASRPTGWGS